MSGRHTHRAMTALDAAKGGSHHIAMAVHANQNPVSYPQSTKIVTGCIQPLQRSWRGSICVCPELTDCKSVVGQMFAGMKRLTAHDAMNRRKAHFIEKEMFNGNTGRPFSVLGVSYALGIRD